MKFKEYRKQIPLNEYIYIQVNNQLRFTTLKKNGTKFNNFYVEYVGTLGGKKWVKLHWVRELKGGGN